LATRDSSSQAAPGARGSGERKDRRGSARIAQQNRKFGKVKTHRRRLDPASIVVLRPGPLVTTHVVHPRSRVATLRHFRRTPSARASLPSHVHAYHASRRNSRTCTTRSATHTRKMVDHWSRGPRIRHSFRGRKRYSRRHLPAAARHSDSEFYTKLT